MTKSCFSSECFFVFHFLKLIFNDFFFGIILTNVLLMFCKSNIYKTIFSYKFPSFFRSSAVSLRGQGGSLGGISANVLGLCVRAGFGAQNCLPALHLIRSTKLQVCTSPRLTQNPCYSQCFFVIRLFMVFLSNLSICPL